MLCSSEQPDSEQQQQRSNLPHGFAILLVERGQRSPGRLVDKPTSHARAVLVRGPVGTARENVKCAVLVIEMHGALCPCLGISSLTAASVEAAPRNFLDWVARLRASVLRTAQPSSRASIVSRAAVRAIVGIGRGQVVTETGPYECPVPAINAIGVGWIPGHVPFRAARVP
jgi:hypothetical protein